MRYGAIGIASEKYFLTWKEDEADNSGFKSMYLRTCAPRGSDLHRTYNDLALFDGGVKTMRVHQYFGTGAARAYVR